METKQRKTACDSLKKFDIISKDNAYIEVTEWTNGEGVDVDMDGTISSFTFGQIEALYHLSKHLEYSLDE